MLLWQGACIVHETFSEQKIIALKLKHPDSELISHPECEASLLDRSDFVGSTSALLKYVGESPKQKFIVATTCVGLRYGPLCSLFLEVNSMLRFARRLCSTYYSVST